MPGDQDKSLRDAIIENASGPKSVTVDGVTTTAHSIKDQIEADKYARSLSAKRRLKIVPIRPGGPV